MRNFTDTIQNVLDRQTIAPQWLRDLAAAHGPDATVEVTVQDTPFGTFLIAATFAPKEE
jgi:hypothetical protein